MNFNVVIPSFNEYESLDLLLKLLIKIDLFNSILIIDGSSSDNTKLIIDYYKNYTNIKFISSDDFSLIKSESPIAKSRNQALKYPFENSYLLFVDLGCIYDEDTFVNMYNTLLHTDNLDYAYTYTKAITTTAYSKIYASLMVKEEIQYTNNHLPSARFLGIKGSVFKELNGFKEKSFAGEDTYFSSLLVKNYKGKKIKGFIGWIVPKSRYEALLKHFKYGYGDVKYKNNLLIFLYCLLIPFVPLSKKDLNFYFYEKILLRYSYGVGGLKALIF
jgi:glycosyltransferase involved in cell wall biosynthesis